MEASAGDVTVRGTRSVVSLPGGELEMVLGVEAGVDDALTRGVPSEILAAQERVAMRRSTRVDPDARAGDDVVAIGDDGSALVLRPL
ncbi:hypothetical protein [Catellatospora sp. NPDC049609]|uniref:hypothetical protein n=1 Tax=Catellatospora sp. NPDC049609 TaxID=3155505 RepID=UPI003415CAA5